MLWELRGRRDLPALDGMSVTMREARVTETFSTFLSRMNLFYVLRLVIEDH